MNTLYASQAIVKPATAVILFDSASRRTPRPFGKGLLSYTPAYRVEYTADDAREWAEMSDRLERERLQAEEEARIEAMAEDAHQFARYMAEDDAYGPADWEEAELSRVFGTAVSRMLV